MKYRCPHCGKVVERDSDKYWVESWCDAIDQIVRLQMVR